MDNFAIRFLMKGASSSANGEGGSVPAPLTGDVRNYLRGDATWAPLVTDWSANTIYYGGDLVMREGSLFKANSQFTSTSTFVDSNWTNISSPILRGFYLGYKAITEETTIAANDIVIEATSGTFTQNLPTAADHTSRVLIFVNSGAGTVTLDPDASETIGASATLGLTQNQTAVIISNGTNWLLLANI